MEGKLALWQTYEQMGIHNDYTRELRARCHTKIAQVKNAGEELYEDNHDTGN